MILNMTLTIIFFIFEWWLGRTKIFKSNSSIDLLIDVAKAVLSIFLRRKM